MYEQLVVPDFSVVGRITFCLGYADRVFGIIGGEATAWQAWLATQLKHTDALPNVAVPVWFSYYGTIDGVYKNWGHVVVYDGNGKFYSSPYKTGTSHAILGSIAEVERIYGCKFVGWSEDITKKRVAQGVQEMKVDVNNLKYLYLGIYAQSKTDAELAADSWIGQDYAVCTQALLDYANRNGFAYWQYKPAAEKQIADLKKQLADNSAKYEQVTVYRKIA